MGLNSGIYQWRCLATNKIYIGSSVNFKRRKQQHLSKLRCGVHENKKLQNTFIKYGEPNLSFEVLEYTDENLLVREQYFIDTLKPVFNVCQIAGATRGVPAWNKGVPMPKSVIEKQQATKRSRIYEPKSISEDHKKVISIKNTGRVKAPEQISAHSEKLKGKPSWNKGLFGYQVSEKRKPVTQFKITGEKVADFLSIAHAERYFGKRLGLTKVIKEKRVRNGYKWEYKTA